jgi:hypothetical protein
MRTNLPVPLISFDRFQWKNIAGHRSGFVRSETCRWRCHSRTTESRVFVDLRTDVILIVPSLGQIQYDER